MMSTLSKGKVVLYLTGIFCAGAVSGWVVAAKTAKEKLFSPPETEGIARTLRERLHSRLDLTPEQGKQIDALIDQSVEEMKTLHGNWMKRIRQAVDTRNAKISAVLTPDQRQQFEQMEKERQDQWRRRESWRGKHGDRDGRRGPPGFGPRDRGGPNHDGSSRPPGKPPAK